MFALFAGEKYYPRGGFRDLKFTADSIQTLLDLANEVRYYDWDIKRQYPESYEWWHIVDLFKREIIMENI